MTRVEWISGALDQTALGELTKELSKFLPGPQAANEAFAVEVNELLDEYRKIYLPAALAAETQPRRLERAVKAGRAFAEAIAKLDGDDRELIAQLLWLRDGKNGPGDFAAVERASQVALAAAEAATSLLDRRRKGKNVGGALPQLVEGLAKAYVESYGERPSSARGGVFEQAVVAIFEVGKITDGRFGEGRLAGVLDRARIGGSSPKRGPKVRR